MKKTLGHHKWVFLVFPLFLTNSCSKHGTLNGTLNGPFGPGGPCITNCPVYNIGDDVLGGKVAYISQPTDLGWVPYRQTGLIVSISDQSTGADWGCTGTSIYGADSTALYTGNINTSNIKAGCSTPGIAARICDALILGPFTGWYLPSKDELNKIYQNRAIIGGFGNNTYWSSSQSSNNNAWSQNFSNGTQNNSGKNTMYYVRAVRTY